MYVWCAIQKFHCNGCNIAQKSVTLYQTILPTEASRFFVQFFYFLSIKREYFEARTNIVVQGGKTPIPHKCEFFLSIMATNYEFPRFNARIVHLNVDLQKYF